MGVAETLAEMGANGGLSIVLLAALLLGLRHATDPDHLTALATLVASDGPAQGGAAPRSRTGGRGRRGARRAAGLGLAWGAGHGLTIVALGLPVLLFNDALPGWAQRTAEALVGAVVAMLAVRLLVRWRRGYFHMHPHEHASGVRHAHPHVHVHPHDHAAAHEHRHEDALGRSPRAAFGIGLLHGTGGSAGVSVLLIAGIDGDAQAVVSLLLFAAGTALSMALVSAGWGRLLVARAVERRLAILAPAFGTASLAFGCWYGLGALG